MTKYFFILLTFLCSSSAIANQSFDLNSFNQMSNVVKISNSKESDNIVHSTIQVDPRFYLYADNIVVTTTPVLALESCQIASSDPIKTIDFANSKHNVYVGNVNIFTTIKPQYQNKAYTINITLQACDGKTICYAPTIFSYDFNQNIVAQTGASIHKIYDQNNTNLVDQLNILQIALLFFIAGILLALTPCTYPLYPIALKSIYGVQHNNKHKRISLVLIYIHGIALIYVGLGVIAAFSGKNILNAIHTTSFNIIISSILILLGLSMFGLLEIRLPNAIQNLLHQKSHKIAGGTYITTFILGIFSSLFLGPCITPPLILAIGFIAVKGSLLYGIVGLYSLSIGMGIPILLLALLGNKLMPKSGMWMNIVKYLLGLLIIAIGIYNAHSLIFITQPILSIAFLILCSAIAYLILMLSIARNKITLIDKILVVVLLLSSSVLIAISPAPASNVSASNLTQIEQSITSDKETVVIIKASWCSICQELEETTFRDPQLVQLLAQKNTLTLDITNTTPAIDQFLLQYQLYGPPAVLIFKDGKLSSKLIGKVTAQQIIDKL